MYHSQNALSSVRVSACDGIAQLFAAEAGDCSALLGHGAVLLALRLMPCLLARLGDESQDIVVAALRVLCEIARDRPALYKTHPQRLLLKLLHKQSNAVAEVRVAAQACLRTCVDATPFLIIFEHLSRLYEHPQKIPPNGVLVVLVVYHCTCHQRVASISQGLSAMWDQCKASSRSLWIPQGS